MTKEEIVALLRQRGYVREPGRWRRTMSMFKDGITAYEEVFLHDPELEAETFPTLLEEREDAARHRLKEQWHRKQEGG